jgi:hypothetical protein
MEEKESQMFHVGDVVKVRRNDPIRGGESARVMQVIPPLPEHGLIREYVVEFQTLPKRFPSSDRFLFCIYREEELMG